MTQRKPAKVSALVRYLRNRLEGDMNLRNVLVEGEISNLRMPGQRHWYFSLKDENASISCVMFASSNQRVTFRPKDGDRVLLRGDVSVYEAGGQVQIIVTGMKLSGTGDLYMQLEELKKKLYQEGLFDEAHKKPLPAYPMDIALVTGDNTAARKDVLITLKNRWPAAILHEYPTPVQGKDAAPLILDALMKAESGNHDLILLVRGGGSIEDLWCFNDETLARYIYIMNTPVVTGIGHEIDFTLCDYTADVRANTPTGAVERAVPDIHEVRTLLRQYQSRMNTLVSQELSVRKTEYRRLAGHPVFARPERLYGEAEMKLAAMRDKLMHSSDSIVYRQKHLQELTQRFYGALRQESTEIKESLNASENRMRTVVSGRIIEARSQIVKTGDALKMHTANTLEKRQNDLSATIRLLDAYSPLKVMERGYSVIYKDGKVISSIEDTEVKDTLKVRMQDGFVHAEVISKEKLHG
ncbi:MAG: exodeoxyribonuclease VII large subunit [Erysipelotrichaceae bacterium]|nr:exodeoxyribonuclease VII large subunit [Erysipelotrichaceae bacterium]